ncbi:MAG: 3-oxoacyl-ACP reductase [Frankiales bacterium]|nr:3-oxoacyl-ACP reductase [Frankiales bacterium]
MELGLAGRRALVLASTRGLGQAIAAGLAAEGALVAVSGRDPQTCAAAAAALPGATAVPGDLTVPGGAADVVRRAAAELGGLDVVVVNTGGGKPGGLLDVTEDDELTAYEAMLRPALSAARAAVPFLRQSPAGRLLFVTARSVLEASPELALSGVFRSGVAAAARSLALELAPQVLVNVLVPGQFDTGALHRFEAALVAHDAGTPEQVRQRHVAAIPLGRVGRAEEFADLAVFLCSARASYVTGSVLRVDGGAVRGY